MVNYCQSSAFDCHIYHDMIIVTGGFSKKSFYYYFLQILLNNLQLVILEFKHLQKTHRISMFSFYLLIFYAFFRNHSEY